MLGKVLSVKSDSIDRAISLYRKALSMQPDIEGYIDLGNLYLKIGDRAKALSAFENALQLDPDAQELKVYIDKIKSGVVMK